MSHPKISIVTLTFDQGCYIEQTIESVLNQQYPNLEYIIIDGGSSDNTVDIIKKYEKHLTYWVSEKDKGQVNAINKGLQYCTGEIFNWLNSDDYLEPGALLKIADAFKNLSVNLVAGKVNNFTETESEVVPNQLLSAEGLMCWHPNVKFIQPGVWMRRQEFIECGGIDEQFHYSFDWDLLIRYLFLFPNVTYLDDLLVHFRLHEQSKTVSSLQKFTVEQHRIIEKIAALEKFSGLHAACNYKIKRTAWTSFLERTVGENHRSRVSKIASIITSLHKQPFDIPVTRMTLGSLRRIMSN